MSKIPLIIKSLVHIINLLKDIKSQQAIVVDFIEQIKQGDPDE